MSMWTASSRPEVSTAGARPARTRADLPAPESPTRKTRRLATHFSCSSRTSSLRPIRCSGRRGSRRRASGSSSCDALRRPSTKSRRPRLRSAAAEAASPGAPRRANTATAPRTWPSKAATAARRPPRMPISPVAVWAVLAAPSNAMACRPCHPTGVTIVARPRRTKPIFRLRRGLCRLAWHCGRRTGLRRIAPFCRSQVRSSSGGRETLGGRPIDRPAARWAGQGGRRSTRRRRP